MLVRELSNKVSLIEFLSLPESEPVREYLNGIITQKIMPQGEHSTLQSELVSSINQIGKGQKVAYAFPELRCTFGGCSIVPDVAIFRWERIPKTPQGKIANQFEIAPDWMIEILSPGQSANSLIRKITFSIEQGTCLGWLIDSQDESVTIFYPEKLPQVKSGEDILPVLEVLKDWHLSVNELFDWLKF